MGQTLKEHIDQLPQKKRESLTSILRQIAETGPLEQGLTYEEFQEEMKRRDIKFYFSGADAFDLFQSHGLAVEIIDEIAKSRGYDGVDMKEFKAEKKKHQELSRKK